MVSEDFKTGDLVWAKMKGYPPWPAKIAEPQSDVKRPSKNKKAYYVYFFGSNNFAWILAENISIHSESMFETLKAKKVTGAYQSAVDALKVCLKSSKKDKSTTPKLTKDDAKKPKTKVVNIFSPRTKKPERKVVKFPHKKVSKKRVHENDVNGEDDYSKYKFPKLKESLDRTEELLFRKFEYQRENLMQSVELKHVEPTNKKIGFIGLGNMGQAIVRNLLKSGHKVAVWNRRQAKCDPFVKLGATKVSHACDLVVECDITFCCVSDPQASKTLIFGEHGILKGLEECEKLNRFGKGYVEMTSIDPETSSAISEAIVTKQGRYLEAPVCGTSKNAEDGSLLILASGDRKLFLDCITCFHAMGKHAYYVSCEVGYGTKMSLLLSMVYGTVCAAVAEAMALAERLNLPHEEFIKILSLGPLQCENIIEKCKMMTEPNPPAITPLKHIQKDINLALLMGDSYSQPMPVNAAANEVYKRGRLMKYSESDVSAVFRTAKF